MFVDHVQMGDWPFRPSTGLAVSVTYSPSSLRLCQFAESSVGSRVKYVMAVSPLQIARARRGWAEINRSTGENEKDALFVAIPQISSP